MRFYCVLSYPVHGLCMSGPEKNISGPESLATKRIQQFLNRFVLVLSLMWSERISGPESLPTEVAGNDDPFKMVGFDVIFYGTAHPLFSTDFAPMSQMASICIFVFALLHQRRHPFFKFLKIPREFAGNS